MVGAGLARGGADIGFLWFRGMMQGASDVQIAQPAHHCKAGDNCGTSWSPDLTHPLLACYAHRGVAHRDVKLENMLLSVPEQPASVRLADLGLAKEALTGSLKLAGEQH